MTEQEKMVWAAAYVAECARQHEERNRIGTKLYIPGAVEAAWAAVADLRGAEEAVAEGWGKDSDVYQMLMEMSK